MSMKNPVHPGKIVCHDCLEPLGLSVTEGAKVLGVTRQALINVVKGKAGISPEMAIRLTKAFGSTVETWLQCSLPTISRKRASMRAKSKSSATRPENWASGNRLRFQLARFFQAWDGKFAVPRGIGN